MKPSFLKKIKVLMQFINYFPFITILQAVLRDERGRVRGLTEIQITQGQWLRVDVVVCNTLYSILNLYLCGPKNVYLTCTFLKS